MTGGKLTAFFLSSPPPDLLLFFAFTLSFLLLKTPIPPPLLRRRTLRPPPMPSSAHLRRTSPIFSSPQSLSNFLSPLLPPNSLSSWGISPGTKTLTNLFIELSSGETSLLLSPSQPSILRTIDVITVKIRDPQNRLLVESRQLLSDGATRIRDRPLSEKMRPEETAEEAALRAVEEELGVCARFVRIVEGSHRVRVEERESGSYPGLVGRYVLHEVEARVGGLPEEGEFATEEKGEGAEERVGGAVFVVRHFWKWVEEVGA